MSPATPRARARDLEAMFADPEVDVVQCLTGGFGSMQLVPHLDFELIAEHPKAFLWLLRHHRPARRPAPAGRAGHLLRPPPDDHGLDRGQRLHPRPAAGGAGGRRHRTGAARPRRPLCPPDARRPGQRAAGRRRPVAAAPDHGHALGDRAGGGDPVLRGRRRAALVRRRDAHPARAGRQAGRGRRGGGGRHGQAATGATSAPSGPGPSRSSRSWRSTWSRSGSRCCTACPSATPSTWPPSPSG